MTDQAQIGQEENVSSGVLGQRKMHFTPLFFSVNGMLGRDNDGFVKRLDRHLSVKYDSPLSRVINYLLTRLRIACAQATHRESAT